MSSACEVITWKYGLLEINFEPHFPRIFIAKFLLYLYVFRLSCWLKKFETTLLKNTLFMKSNFISSAYEVSTLTYSY